jgi:adenylate kinase family enzyme
MLHRLRAHFRRLLKASNDILPKLPNKGDSKLSTIVKIASLADTAYGFVYGDEDPAQEYLNQFTLLEKQNSQFVSLFFSSFIRKDFKVSYIKVSDDQRVIQAEIPDNGTLFFTEWTYDGGTKSDTFHYTPKFDFKKLLSSMWDAYNGKIYVSISGDFWSRSKGATFSEFPAPKDKVYGKACLNLKEMVKKDLQYRIDDIPRCFLFVGEPGTGKSTFAVRMTEHSERVLKLNAKGLHSVSADNMNFLLDGLEPEYIIIDDIDRIMMSSSLTTLLSILDMIKDTHPDTVLILTANDPDELSRALKRPGRIDEIIEFPAQSKKERKKILVGYMKVFKSELTKEQIEKILKKTEGLTAAYMRELAIQAKYLSFEELMDHIAKVNKYAFGRDAEAKKEAKKAKKKKKDKKPKKKNKKPKKKSKKKSKKANESVEEFLEA